MKCVGNITLAVFCFIGAISRAFAYGIPTHQDLTEAAALRSVLALDSASLKDMGLDGGIRDPGQQFPNSRRRSGTIVDLLRDGADFEDSLFPTLRPLRHFYNPITSSGLDVPPLAAFMPSPDWALARPGSVSDQEFSYGNARQYFYDALTKSTKEEREAAFGKTFQALGQAVHHVQDMAQPQHVRNDPHCESIACALLGAYSPSLYERWTDENKDMLPKDPSSFGYDITSPDFASTFNSLRRFWNTEPPGPNAVTSGKGIAEFTNRNFVSAGTNFDRPGLFPSPILNERNKLDLDIQQLCGAPNSPCPNPNLTGVMTFYGNVVEDKYTGEVASNPFASALSIFDAELSKTNGTPLGQSRLFALNRFNFVLAHAFLIPRAVGYSAGLINYFFRGKLDYVPDQLAPGNFLIKNLGPEDMSGKFALYYDTKDGTRKAVLDYQNAPVVWETETPLIARTGKLSITPAFDPPADAKVFNQYMLVFTGAMGEEKPDNGSVGAVVAKVIENPYSGALYLAGRNAANEVVHLKVDKNGVSPVKPGDPNPLDDGATIDRNSARAYSFKQSVITTTPSGVQVHKTISLSYRRSSFASNDRGFSLALNPVTGQLVLNQGVHWLAQSPDPTIGSFEFALDIRDGPGFVANVIFTRRFTDANNKIKTTSGSFPLPNRANTVWNYHNFAGGLMIVSGDGTTFYPRGHTWFNRVGIKIALAATPSAALFDLPQMAPDKFASGERGLTSSSNGSCSIDYLAANSSGGPPIPATATNQNLHIEKVTADSTQSRSGIDIEGIVRDQLVSSQWTVNERVFERITVDECAVSALSVSTGQSLNKVNVEYHSSFESSNHSVGELALPNGAPFLFEVDIVQKASTVAVLPIDCSPSDTRIEQVFSAAALNSSAVNIDYSYRGLEPCAPISVPVMISEDHGTSKKSMLQALTDRADDAIYRDGVGPSMVLKFKNSSLPSDTTYVADASPLGEVFVASRDLSVIEHHPVSGNMPQITRDMIPGIVTLLAAIWM